MGGGGPMPTWTDDIVGCVSVGSLLVSVLVLFAYSTVHTASVIQL